MDSWFEFVLERYNYWIVIALMMTGLYIVFARGNLVKKIVGLNIFQTSVFIYYITIGQIAGGTAPIYMGGELDHGGGHEAPAGHAADAAAHEAGHSASEAAALHAKIDNSALDHSNDLKEALKTADSASSAAADSLHQSPAADADKISNTALSHLDKTPPAGDLQAGFDVAHSDVTYGVADAAHHAAEIVYTNPLPHVLILTAIVVGVATTAVGLALAVRIREAYGTIEEDELEAADDIAEFGHEPGSPAQAGVSA